MSYDPNQPPPPGYQPPAGGPTPPPGYQPPPPPPGYQGPPPQGQPGSNDSMKLLLLSIFSLLCCAPVAIYTLIKSKEARESGTADGQVDAAFFVSIAALVLWALAIVANLTVR